MPAIARLSGLRFAAATELHASVRLLLTLPPRDAVVGSSTVDGAPTTSRCPSYARKKKNLSFRIGPPAVAPNCSRAVSCLGPPRGINGLVASRALSRPNAYAVPCSPLVPDFNPMFAITPRLPAVLGFRVLLDVELLDGVDRQQRCRVAGNAGRVDRALGGEAFDGVDAIQDVHVVLGAEAVGTLAPLAAARKRHHSGAQLQQTHEVAAVQRQVVDDLIAEGSAEHRAGAIDQRNLTRHGKGGLGVSGFERKVDAHVLGDFQPDVSPLHILETR